MSRIDYGQVDIELGGETITLKPTLAAMQKIDRRFGSIRGALEQCGSLSLDALVAVIVAGAGMGSQQAKNIPEQVFAAGVLNVGAPVAEYLGLLMNPSGKDAEPADEGKD